MRKPIALAIIVLAACATEASAQSTIFVVRHAERTDTGAAKPLTDPDLSEAGHARAARLAAALKSAGITAIFVTATNRTRQTADPLARALSLTPVVLDSKDAAGLIQRLDAHRGAALVVGHSNTVPDIVKRLGVDEPVTVADTEFDWLFVVVRPRAGDTTLLKLRY